jgi:serine/threonine-protein kinase
MAAFRDLGATMVVKGKIQHSGQTVQITVDLIDAKELRQIGSATLQDASGNLAALQDAAVTSLAHMMKIRVAANPQRAPEGATAPTAYEAYLKALGYLQRYDKPGNTDLAIAALESSVATDPQFALGYAELGAAYRVKNQVDPNPKWIALASTNLQRASQLDDKLPITYVELGRLHSSLGKHDLALQEFQKALAVNPRDAEAINGLARSYERMGRIGDAEASYKRAIALRPDYWDGLNSLGMFYTRQNRNQDAVAQFERVVSLTPDNATAYSNLASAYLNLGGPAQEQAAEKALQRSIALAPSYAAYANLGALLFHRKNFTDSAAMTRKALQLNDQDYRVWDNLRLAYLWLHDDGNARSATEKTMALLEPQTKNHPEDAAAQVLLAKLLAPTGKSEAALSHLEMALALAPKDPDVLGDAAEAYALLGNSRRAQELIQSSLANGETLDDLQTRFGLQRIFADPNFRASGKN